MAKDAANTASSANKAEVTSLAEGSGLSLIAAQARESGGSGDAVGVDKIRDLLFGNQMQDYDRRFSKLEERFLQRFKDVESEAKRNLEMYRVQLEKAGRTHSLHNCGAKKRREPTLTRRLTEIFANKIKRLRSRCARYPTS